MSTFASALKKHLDSLSELGLMERRALRIVSDATLPRHQRILERWEAGSRDALGLDPSGFIDWFKQNWVTILQVVLSVLSFLLMFAAEPPEGGMTAAADGLAWAPGDLLWKLIGGRAAAYARKKWPNFPGTDDDLAAFFTAEVREAMS